MLNNTEMKNSNEENILGIIIDNKSSKAILKMYVRKLCKKSGLCSV